MKNTKLLPALMGTRWELELFSPHLLVQVRLAQLLHRRTVVSLPQDGINSSFWMVQLRLTLNGCVLEEIHLSLVIGQICPVSLYLVFKILFNVSFAPRLRTLISLFSLFSNLSTNIVPLFVDIAKSPVLFRSICLRHALGLRPLVSIDCKNYRYHDVDVFKCFFSDKFVIHFRPSYAYQETCIFFG